MDNYFDLLDQNSETILIYFLNFNLDRSSLTTEIRKSN